MVCLGNICRSPLAEGLLQYKSNKHQLRLQVDSAGMHELHAGEPPHFRSIEVAKDHGIDICTQSSRKIKIDDFEEFDLILAMDNENISDMKRLTYDVKYIQKIRLIMEYAGLGNIDVPDPYYDGRFELVYEMLDEATDAIIEKFKRKYNS